MLYDQCLAVRPDDGSDWIFKDEGKPEISKESAKAVLDLIHSNREQIPESMHFVTILDAVVFTARYKMFDRYHIWLKEWYHAMSPANEWKTRNCCRLWLAHKLGLKDEFMDLQEQAIFHLCDNGKGGLGDPDEQFNRGTPLDLSKFSLADETITGKFKMFRGERRLEADPIHPLDRIIRLRSKAIHLILTKLSKVQVAMLSTENGSIGHGFKGSGCKLCLNQWAGCLNRCLLQPGSGLPSFFPVPEAVEYHGSLDELCNFVGILQLAINAYKPDLCRDWPTLKRACFPPQLVGRKDAMSLVKQGLESCQQLPAVPAGLQTK